MSDASPPSRRRDEPAGNAIAISARGGFGGAGGPAANNGSCCCCWAPATPIPTVPLAWRMPPLPASEDDGNGRGSCGLGGTGGATGAGKLRIDEKGDAAAGDESEGASDGGLASAGAATGSGNGAPVQLVGATVASPAADAALPAAGGAGGMGMAGRGKAPMPRLKPRPLSPVPFVPSVLLSGTAGD